MHVLSMPRPSTRPASFSFLLAIKLLDQQET
jgi:hypothetical protein